MGEKDKWDFWVVWEGLDPQETPQACGPASEAGNPEGQGKSWGGHSCCLLYHDLTLLL